MITESTLERYLEALLAGDRAVCRSVIEETMQTGTPVTAIYTSVIWPVMVEIEKLCREDRVTLAQEHLATRLNRALVDQLQNKLPRKTAKDKKIIICCAEAEVQELGAQIIADLFESDGWQVKFLGGGLSNEDILTFTGEYAPEILLIYGSTPQQAPSIRKLIDFIKDVNAHPNMRIMLSGGVFNRAEGLWQEIGADLFAADAVEAVEQASTEAPEHPEDQRTLNRRKRKRKKELAEATA